ncbi:uncharacterized protein LOC122030931 [Zingiber officinale]|uniref:uncharacterized protein LOC122030931 n=1 Tax=Zingiber officinale TaxID=94328 RepID=UPI001C4C6CA9|nr:uncharacterized protein LOC122030931 [Zingiber officinale]
MTSTSTSTSLAWQWVIEALARREEFDISVLGDFILKNPVLLNSAPSFVREAVSLRFLEALVNLHKENSSVWYSGREIDPNLSCEEVLCQQTRKFCHAARLFNLGKDRVKVFNGELHNFIIQKKASFPKTFLQKLKEKILRDRCPALLPLMEMSGLPIQNKSDDAKCNACDGSQMAKQLEISIQENQIQQLGQGSAAQNIGDTDRFLDKNSVPKEHNYQRSNDFTEDIMLKRIKLNSDHHYPGIHNSVDFAHGSNTAASREVTSESMQCLLKKNGAEAGIVKTEGNDKTSIQSSFCGFLTLENSGVISPQLPFSDKIVVQEDSNGLGSHFPLESSVACDVGGHLKKDSSIVQQPCDENVSFQETPKNGSKEKTIAVLHEKICLNIQSSVAPIRDDDRTLEGLSDFGPNHYEAFATEKCYLPRLQANISDDSIGDCTEESLCIKCNNGGELLNCSNTDCFISVHEACLKSSPQFETSGLFYCPFCLCDRAAIAYRKAKENYLQKRKCLSVFVGGDFARKHQKMISSTALQRKKQSIENSPVLVNGNSSGCTRDQPVGTSIEPDEQTRQVVVPQSRVNCKLTCQRGSPADINDDMIVREVALTIENANVALNKVDVVHTCSNSDHVEVTKNQQPGDPHTPAHTIHVPFQEDSRDSRQVHHVRQSAADIVGNSCGQLNVKSSLFRRVDPRDTSSLENEQGQQADNGYACEKSQVLLCHKVNQEGCKGHGCFSNHPSISDDNILCGVKSLIQNVNDNLSRGDINPGINGEQINIGENQQRGEPIFTADSDLPDPCVKYAHGVQNGNSEIVGNICGPLNVESNQFNMKQVNEVSVEANLQAPQPDSNMVDSAKASHTTTNVDDNKVVCKVVPLLQNVNTDLIEEDPFPCNTKEQIKVEKEKQLEDLAVACNDHFTFLRDSSDARYVDDAEQGDVRMINYHNKVEAHNEEEDENAEKISTRKSHRNKFSARKSKRSQPMVLSQRRRFLWTREEVEVLKEAIHKFGKKPKGNISWIKILEYGRHIFHESREPKDLREKWKNLMKKEGSSTGT